MDKVIDVKNLGKAFNEKPVLKSVSFFLKKNENIALLGKSGSGKSVLMKILVGLIEPDYGQVKVLGNEVAGMSESELIELRKKIGYVFQEGALYDSMTVEQNISFSLKRQGSKSKDLKQSVGYALDSVGLSKAIYKMPDELSGGMKKRVALARTLVLKPEIILYDEPTAGLDPVTSKEIIRLILDMKRNKGISSIIATHDMICTKMTADRILILNDGEVAAEGEYADLVKSTDKVVSGFFN